MVGCRSGVAVQLKGYNPAMIAVHSVAHQLVLAASQYILHQKIQRPHLSDVQTLPIIVLSVLLLLKQLRNF